MSRPRPPFPAALAAVLLAAFAANPAFGQDPPAAEAPAESPELAKERRTAERFLTLLERNPRPGTALDRAYAFYAERGELAALADRLRERADRTPTRPTPPPPPSSA